MERTKQKSKKDKPNKYVDKEKSSFKADIKTLKENLKIREILRTVKMNSSMRVKAPSGSKVMDKDFNESEDIFEDKNDEGQVEAEPPSATNAILMTDIESDIVPKEDQDVYNDVASNANVAESEVMMIRGHSDETDTDISIVYKSKSLSEGIQDGAECDNNAPDVPAPPLPSESPGIITRERKLSLDHKMLSRREGMSQSEADLHTIGKSPLERKSSFFKKKMDSFVKNTTEIFKRQSLGSKPIPSLLVQRRDSTCSQMSVSLQSLNENSAFCGAFQKDSIDEYHLYPGSITSLRSYTPARSNSSVSVNVSDRPPDMSEESLSDSRQDLVGSQPLPEIDIPGGMNEFYKQDSFLNTRAISMSSGLDTVTGQRRRKTSRFNRVSWLASESLTNYFRSLISDEKIQESQANCLQPDFATPAHKYGPRTDSKGRRLSYVRAVSGEDSSKAQDSSLRRKKTSKNEGRPNVTALLESFSRYGLPNLYGYDAWQMCPEALAFLNQLCTVDDVKNFLNFGEYGKREEAIIELIQTEVAYIHILKIAVHIFLTAAHSLQYHGALAKLESRVLFLNLPDILNANLKFWERTIYPMLAEAKEKNTGFNVCCMTPGFREFAETFEPYEEYTQNLLVSLKHLRQLFEEAEFMKYVFWCEHHIDYSRLEIADVLVRPMQRITKYSLMLDKIKMEHSSDAEPGRQLNAAGAHVKTFTQCLNRSLRQKQEIDSVERLKIEEYQPDFKGDDELRKLFKTFSAINLFLPMLECDPHMIRCLIYEGPLRYKDFLKEFDAHVLVFTDMMLICKALSKTPKHGRAFKMLRPKILLNRIVPKEKVSKSGDIVSLIYVILDEFGSYKDVFQLSETSKDPYPCISLRMWKAKIIEAMMTYALAKWYYQYPVEDITIVEKNYYDESYKKNNQQICALEMKARERVAAMMIPNKRFNFPDAAKEMDIPQTGYDRERGPSHLHTVAEFGIQHFNAWQARGPNFRRQEPLEINPYFLPAENVSSGSSHGGRREGSRQRSRSSAEQHLRPRTFDDNRQPPSIKVNMVKDKDGLAGYSSPVPPSTMLQQPSTSQATGPHSASAEVHTLHVSQTRAMVHNPPDTKAELPNTGMLRAQTWNTASQKVYSMHYERMIKPNRHAACQCGLPPGYRGASNPPPNPTGPLERGSAFSNSSKSSSHSSLSSFSDKVQKELQKLRDMPHREQGFDDVSELREEPRRDE